MMRVWLTLIVVASSGACYGDGAAEVTVVEPARGDALSSTPIHIYGRGFDCGVDERFDGATDVSWSFSAWMGTTPLTEVTWWSDTWLTAVVPAGLATGNHELVVVRPDGRRLKLANAFAVDASAAPAACDASDLVVTDVTSLLAAASVARATSGVQRICIDASVALNATVTIDSDVVMVATSRGELRGEGLPVATRGLLLTGASVALQHMRFVGFAAGAVRAQGTVLTVSDTRFDACSPGLDVGAVDVIDSRFVGGSLGARAQGVRDGVVRVRRSIFSGLGRGIDVDDSDTLIADNNTFHRIGSESVRAEEVGAVYLRNNIFHQFGGDAAELSSAAMAEPATANALSPEVACSNCPFGPSNPVLDCALVDADGGDFRLTASSPCVERGVDVGLPYLGAAPDLGAVELR